MLAGKGAIRAKVKKTCSNFLIGHADLEGYRFCVTPYFSSLPCFSRAGEKKAVEMERQASRTARTKNQVCPSAIAGHASAHTELTGIVEESHEMPAGWAP